MLGRLFKRRENTEESGDDSLIDDLVPRREEREAVYAEAILLSRSGVEKRGILMDLSEHGGRMRFVSADGLLPGDMVKVRALLKSFRGIGVVRWKDKTDIGIQFHKRAG
ncbi:MAG: PilZ domain-containing protein [Pseudomonadota bacterium]